MSTKKSIQLFTLLAASLLATACGSKSESTQSSAARSSSRVTASSGSKKMASSASASAKATAASRSTQSEQASSGAAQGASSSSSAIAQEKPKTESGQSAQTDASQLNLEAIATGDFSSLAGTWVNSKGASLTIDAHGVVTSLGDGYVVHPWTFDANTGIISAGVTERVSRTGFGIIVFPAGKIAVDQDGRPVTEYMRADDRDHIQVGQSLVADDERYYKQ